MITTNRITLLVIFLIINFVSTSQVIKKSEPTHYGIPVDSIVYELDSVKVHQYHNLKKTSVLFTCFYPISGSYDKEGNLKYGFHKVNKNGRDYYYDTSNFKIEDSVYVHGELFLIDEKKPQRVNWDEYDKAEIETDAHYNYEHLPIWPIPNAKGRCILGLKDGTWIFYNGAFAKIEEHYKKGIRDGLYTIYDDNNNILYQTTFVNGSGVEKIYAVDGTILEEKSFIHDMIDSTKIRIYYYRLDGKLKRVVNPKLHIEERYRRIGSPLYERYFNKIVMNDLSKLEEHEFRFRYRRDGTFEQMEHFTDSVVNYTIYGTKRGGVKKIRPCSLKNTLQYYRFKKLSKMGTQELNAMEEKYYRLGE